MTASYNRSMRTILGARGRLLLYLSRLAIATGTIAVAIAFTGIAQAQEAADTEPVFGLRPALLNPDDPKASGYFTFYVTPGEVLTDEVILINEGQVPVDLSLYLSAATTAVGGSASFGSMGDENDPTSWITLSSSAATLAPGDELAVPFTVTIPEDAQPGDHMVGMVTQLAASDEEAADSSAGGVEASFSMQVIRRIGVAVLMIVEGERTPNLEILDVALVDQSDQGVRFFVTVHNTGNVMLKGQGTVTVSDPLLGPLTEFQFDMDTVLADNTAGFYITGPVVLGDGKYELSANISTAAVRGPTPEAPGLIPAGRAHSPAIEFAVVDGGPPEETQLTVPPPELVLEAVESSVEVKNPISGPVLLGIGAATMLVLYGAIRLLTRRRKRKSQPPSSSGD